LTKEDGTKYTGSWFDNMRFGYGEEITPDGKVFEGVFENDQRNGYGTEIDKNA
jgi:hypothetical protein